MKKQKNIFYPSKEQQENSHQKRLYKKPQLGTVQLFADQVLGTCPQENVCGDFPRIS